MESPVCTPIGSRFSIEHTTTKVPAESRMTSSSNSFHPSTDASTRTWWEGEASRPFWSSLVKPSRSWAAPPPHPPRVKEGRRIAGNPMLSRAESPPSREFTVMAGNTGRPASSMARRKASRSSASRMDRTEAPSNRTPSRSRTPSSSSSIARLRAVWPPRVGMRASGRSFSRTAITVFRVRGST